MNFRDRVLAFRRVRADSLRAHPGNWRRHPQEQQQALRGVLAEIGFASALLVRELADGVLEIIDGHLRAETAADALVPVLVLDVSEAEAAKLLATFDPLSAMAQADHERLNSLVVDLDVEREAVKTLLDRLLEDAEAGEPRIDADVPRDKQIGESFQVLVECGDETVQRKLFERLEREGYTCRLRVL